MNKVKQIGVDKHIALLLFVVILMLNGCKQSSKVVGHDYDTTEQIGNNQDDNYLSIIVENYTKWDNVAMSGKISMDKLPLSPTAKIYMQKDEEIIVSLRVPLLGEVGRVEIDNKNLKAFNKLKNVYIEEDFALLADRFNLSVGNLQDILLARLFVVGKGTLTEKHKKMVEKHEYDSEPNAWYIIPKEKQEAFNYGFKTDKSGKMLLLHVAANESDTQATFNYTPKEEGYKIKVQLDLNGKVAEATFDYSTVDWTPDKIEKLSVTNGWRKVSVKDFLKSF